MYENPVGAFLIGDEGYGISPWLFTPYIHPDTADQQCYNRIHCRERVVIERVFGQMKRRFPFLQNTMRMSTQRVPSMVVACSVLHNVAKYLQDDDFEGNDDVEEMVCSLNFGHVDDVNTDIKMRGSRRRDAIATFLTHNYAETHEEVQIE